VMLSTALTMSSPCLKVSTHMQQSHKSSTVHLIMHCWPSLFCLNPMVLAAHHSLTRASQPCLHVAALDDVCPLQGLQQPTTPLCAADESAGSFDSAVESMSPACPFEVTLPCSSSSRCAMLTLSAPSFHYALLCPSSCVQCAVFSVLWAVSCKLWAVS
jgi:hypothetical protein